ncbi:GMC family oxidoreductase [Sinorhizobium meliloti]|nr:GMC family oxidoreductase [Sinorhizobium meliloti]RVO23333.1 GMC family oxidoreductase [Sinorhizobium meliloti]
MARTDFNIIVIGSGAGGAPIAYEMARKGRSVLVLEKGPLLRPQDEAPGDPKPSDFKRDELFATGPEKRLTIPLANHLTSIFNSHVEPDLNDEPHVYRNSAGEDYATIEGYTAQVVGGGTQLYGAVSLRFTELDLRLQSFNDGRALREDPKGDVAREARDWPITYDDLEPYYCKAEKLLGLNGEQVGQAKVFSDPKTYQKPLSPNPISRFARDGMITLGMTPYRTPLAVITEDHVPSGRVIARDAQGQPDPEAAKTGYVNRYGDPLGLKSNTYVALLRPTLRHTEIGSMLDLRANCLVTHLSQQNGRITGVHYLDPSGAPRIATGQTVVVACSAIESVRLLLLSGEMDAEFARRLHSGRSPADSLVGKYFLTHCFGGAEGDVPQPMDKSRSLDSDYATDFCATREFLDKNGIWAGAAIYNNTSDQALPISLARTHGAQDLDTIWRAYVDDSSLVGDKFLAWLKSNFQRGLSVSFMANQVPMRTNRIELHSWVRDKWNRPVAYIIKGWHQHDRYLMARMAEMCRDILQSGGVAVQGFGHVGDDARARIANHILGGLRFGPEPEDSVLDPDCRHWQFDNLYVTDGAYMPTSGGANPTLTIQANAFRVADKLP